MEKFWKKWRAADYLKRIDLISELPIESHIQEITEISKDKKNKIGPQEKSRLIAQFLNGYFEDLESCAEHWK